MCLSIEILNITGAIIIFDFYLNRNFANSYTRMRIKEKKFRVCMFESFYVVGVPVINITYLKIKEKKNEIRGENKTTNVVKK